MRVHESEVRLYMHPVASVSGPVSPEVCGSPNHPVPCSIRLYHLHGATRLAEITASLQNRFALILVGAFVEKSAKLLQWLVSPFSSDQIPHPVCTFFVHGTCF